MYDVTLPAGCIVLSWIGGRVHQLCMVFYRELYVFMCSAKWPFGDCWVSQKWASEVLYEGVSKIFRTGAVKIINLFTKRVWKLPTSTQLRVTWHTDSLDMVVLPPTGASRCHNCCMDGGTSPEYFEYTLVFLLRANDFQLHHDTLC
jgi:hypothetical protein